MSKIKTAVPRIKTYRIAISSYDAKQVVVRDAEDALGLLDGVLQTSLPDLRTVRAAQRLRLELRRRPSGREQNKKDESTDEKWE